MTAEMDAVDLDILEQLRADGRVPFSQVADAVGLDQAEVERRVEALRTSGVLSVVGFLNTRQLGFDEVHYHIAADPGRIPEMVQRLKGSPNVRYAARVSGPRPLYLNCLFAEPAERRAFESGLLREVAGDGQRDQHLVEEVYLSSYDYSLMKTRRPAL